MTYEKRSYSTKNIDVISHLRERAPRVPGEKVPDIVVHEPRKVADTWKNLEALSTGECWWEELGDIRRGLDRAEAWFDFNVGLAGFRVDLVTFTRTERCRTPAAAAGFKDGVSTMLDLFVACGAIAAGFYLEAVVKSDEEPSEVACCSLPGCPACDSWGRVKAAHLHAHAVVVAPLATRYPYKLLQGAARSLGRQHDPAFGNIDVQNAAQPLYAFGYMSKYASKAGPGRAWLYAMCGARFRVRELLGHFRGTTTKLVTLPTRIFDHKERKVMLREYQVDRWEPGATKPVALRLKRVGDKARIRVKRQDGVWDNEAWSAVRDVFAEVLAR